MDVSIDHGDGRYWYMKKVYNIGGDIIHTNVLLIQRAQEISHKSLEPCTCMWLVFCTLYICHTCACMYYTCTNAVLVKHMENWGIDTGIYTHPPFDSQHSKGFHAAG